MANDPFGEEVNESEKRNRYLVERKDSDLKKVLESVQGRRMLWNLMDLAGVFRTVFNTNALQMAFNEGHRDLGLMVLNDIIRIAPLSFTQMQNESVSDYRSWQAEIKKKQTEE